LAHLAASPIPRGQRVLFNRRFLDLERGELPSPLQAGAWLELKRTYMEMRPFLRRAYGAVREAEVYGPIFQRLGFQPLGAVELDGYTYALGVLDMGPGSVDAWLAGLVAAELGLVHDQLLDVDARELVVDGHRQSLTTLEFGVMRYLSEREGKAVTRVDLERDVWGYDYQGGSNVVDVVIRALRRKLGERASVIETVHGAGYRYRNNA
jgi:DNA-binding response OmpR family regulator